MSRQMPQAHDFNTDQRDQGWRGGPPLGARSGFFFFFLGGAGLDGSDMPTSLHRFPVYLLGT